MVALSLCTNSHEGFLPSSRFIPRYNARTDEAEFLRGGEADVGDNRIPEGSEEMAELGQNYSNHSNHSNGYSYGYPASNSGNAVHPQPSPGKYESPLGVQHSIPLN